MPFAQQSSLAAVQLVKGRTSATQSVTHNHTPDAYVDGRSSQRLCPVARRVKLDTQQAGPTDTEY